MKARTWRILTEWVKLLDRLDRETAVLSGGYERSDVYREAHAYYLSQSDKMRANLDIVLVERVESDYSWALVDLLVKIHPDWMDDLPDDAPGLWQRVPHHILCRAQAAGLYQLSGALSVGTRLIWRPLDTRCRVEATVVGTYTRPDGERWVNLETPSGTFPNEEEVVREACVRAL